MHWYERYDIGEKNNWDAADLDESSWKPVSIPGGFAELGVPDTPAVAWFRKEITLPDSFPAGRALLYLGEIERSASWSDPRCLSVSLKRSFRFRLTPYIEVSQ